jgi:SAM-dependent methyltransferase
VATSYDAAFFAAQADGSRRSADRIVPLVIDAVSPRSVIDVGCGVGTWLAAFQAAGVEDLHGIDGAYVDRAQLQIPASAFEPADLRQPLTVTRRFDLAVSLEVAEHLPPARGASFVADLATLAPVVLFSAAIPEQTGTDHIGPRWQDEWAALFARHGLRPVDVVRPRVWDDDNVEWWYAQNTLLYVPHDHPLHAHNLPLRLVHPRLFQGIVEAAQHSEPKTFRQLVPEVYGAAIMSAKWHIARRHRREPRPTDSN